MIRLISYGDHLEKGSYKVHSRFRRVVNFISGNQLASVVHPSVGGGPLNLVVDGADLTVLNHLTINDDSFSLNEEVISLDESKKFDSEIELYGYDKQRFDKNIKYFEELLILQAPDKSLTFLLDANRKRHFKTRYEMELVRRFESAMSQIHEKHFPANHAKKTKEENPFRLFRVFRWQKKEKHSGNLVRAIRMIKGAGFGLTPSGDDFIAGWLQALNLRQKLFKIDYRDLIQKISNESRSNSFLTNAFLYASAKGWLNENFKDLIRTLFDDSKNIIEESMNQVLTHGATSGADWCVGFLLGMNKPVPQSR